MKILIDDHCSMCGRITKDCGYCYGKGHLRRVYRGDGWAEEEAVKCDECNGTGCICPEGCK